MDIMKKLNKDRQEEIAQQWRDMLLYEYQLYLEELSYQQLDKLRMAGSFDCPVRY